MVEVGQREPAVNSEDPAGLQPPAAAVRGALDLRGVVFAYPARPDAFVFQGFSLSIKAGETVAFVGPSGSGKSTVVALMERCVPPTW